MGKALYRKYRSKTLDEIVGQSHIIKILKQALAHDRIAHAYLLTGPRGVGKTSIARILAHEINHIPYTDDSDNLDIIEIDAASNNSVEDVRDLREKVRLAPIVGPKKIYIIDEVHMLSKSAFNALLKTLEEPPAHVVFILATTDVDKLPATIISRVQHFHFRSISVQDITKHLTTIAANEHIAIEPDALKLIAIHGGGSFRDSIGLLDQLQSLSDETITQSMVESVLGLATGDLIDQILAAYSTGDIAAIVSLIDQAETTGTPPELLAQQLITTAQQVIATQPEFLGLLDALIEVPRSSWPHIKLLTALTGNVNQRRVAPQNIPSKEVFQSDNKPQETPAQQTSPQKPVAEQETTKNSTTTAPKKKKESTPTTTSTPIKDFPWQDFLAAVGTTVGAYTLLAKSSYEYNGTLLTIYAGKPFSKKQIDKSLPALNEALQKLNIPAEIETKGGAKPPRDSKKAAILAMMGGGEEVKIDG